MDDVDETTEKLFVTALVVLMTIGNVMMGCELDLNVVWKTLKRPTAPLIGFFAQFFWMPLLSYTIAKLILAENNEYAFALGLFVTGCAPGGGASNFWTYLLGGNTNLSITMTFLSTVASFIMIPVWMNLLGFTFLQGLKSTDVHLTVPYMRLVSILVGLLVPLMIGVAIARFRPSWATRARKALRPWAIFFLLFVIFFGAWTGRYIFKLITYRAIISGLLLAWCGFMFGCFTALLTRQPPEDVTAIAIETGIQNTGIAIAVLKLSIPTPAAYVGMVMPVIFACSIPGPLLLGYTFHRAIRRIKDRRRPSADDELQQKRPVDVGSATTPLTTENVNAPTLTPHHPGLHSHLLSA